MRILLDECTPRILKRHLRGVVVATVQEMGWHGVTNGELLRRMANQFDVLITTDKNLRFQHDLTEIVFAIIVLPSNQLPTVMRLVDNIQAAVRSIQPGQVVEIQPPA